MPEMVFKCKYCRETNKSFVEMLKHEKTCWVNPEIKSCFNCEHRETQGPFDVYDICLFDRARDIDCDYMIDCEDWVKK